MNILPLGLVLKIRENEVGKYSAYITRNFYVQFIDNLACISDVMEARMY